MAAGVIDDLELIQVEVQQRIGRLACLGTFQRALETALELAPVDQSRENIVARVVAEPAVELARFADVMENQHAARDDAFAVPNW